MTARVRRIALLCGTALGIVPPPLPRVSPSVRTYSVYDEDVAKWRRAGVL